jgi:transcriptional regulator with XRE-family HTH domain
MARTRNFAEVIRAKLAADPKLAEAVEQEAFNADIAMKVYQARTEAGLTQAELAARIGTRQSVISRIEDADYEGHSLSILRRIASALDLNVRVDFTSKRKTSRQRAKGLSH